MSTANPPSDVADELPEDVVAAWATVLLDIPNKTGGNTPPPPEPVKEPSCPNA